MPFDDGQGRAKGEFFGILGVRIGTGRTLDFWGFEGLNEFGV